MRNYFFPSCTNQNLTAENNTPCPTTSGNLTASGTLLEMPHKANKPFWAEPPPYLFSKKGRGKDERWQETGISFQ